jgi:hypothetical protein
MPRVASWPVRSFGPPMLKAGASPAARQRWQHLRRCDADHRPTILSAECFVSGGGRESCGTSFATDSRSGTAILRCKRRHSVSRRSIG